MKHLFTIAVILLTHIIAKSQEANWDAYLAQYEDGVGSTTLNMGLVQVAPKKDLPFIVITGVTYSPCSADGLPEKEEFNKLYEISDKVQQIISTISLSELAGTFTHRCERLDYIYIRDTVNIRKKLVQLYTAQYQSYDYYISIGPDPEWEAYLKFLYPNEETLEYMSNEKVLDQLRLAGDKLIKPRQVDHWLYFVNAKDRDSFIRYVEKEKFKIEAKDYIKNSQQPYQLHISRIDSVDPESINKLTLALKQKAKEFSGDYDGWETVVLTE